MSNEPQSIATETYNVDVGPVNTESMTFEQPMVQVTHDPNVAICDMADRDGDILLGLASKAEDEGLFSVANEIRNVVSDMQRTRTEYVGPRPEHG